MPYPTHILVNDFALRSLRETADKDYVHARLAYRSKLVPQFLWSSLHALEKYVKCILVLNRIDATRVKHEVKAGLQRLNASGKFKIDLSKPAMSFVDRLEAGARFRYYETSYHAVDVDLPKLDRAVWELRRYCQPLDYAFEVDGTAQDQLQNNLRRLRLALEAGEKGTCIAHGWLETVIETTTHSAREALLWKNLYFGKSKRTSVRIANFMEAGNSPLYLHPEIVDEVARYIYLPEKVKAAYRELHTQRLAGNE